MTRSSSTGVTARLIAGAMASVVLMSPVALDAQSASPTRSPGDRPAPQTTEEGIWTISNEAEQAAGFSAMLERDEDLNAYVRGIQCRVARDYCDDLRLSVFRRPAFNATVMPNGYTEVWSGLLLRAENEAQVAFVLGHELAHFKHNHSLLRFEDMRRRQGALLALSVVVSAAATYDSSFVSYSQYADIIQTAAYLGQVAALFAYSREHEREADAIGQSLMAEAGYDPGTAADTWRTLIELNAASDNDRVRRSSTQGGIFRSHPITTERLESLDKAAHAVAAEYNRKLKRGYEEHRKHIRPFLDDWLRDEVRRRDFGMMLALLDHLEPGGDEGIIHFYRGETYRLRRQEGDLEQAMAAYRQAATFDDAPAEAYKQLGMALRRAGEAEEARQALVSYLEKAPDADDAGLVTRLVEQLLPDKEQER